MSKYLVRTWGCQMNEHDSEIMAGILENMGYLSCDKEIDADIIVYNTCLIRENAEFKLYGNLGHLKNIKKNNPNLIIAVCGCLPQKEEYLKILKENYPFVDLIFGTHNYHELAEFIQERRETKVQIAHVLDKREEMVNNLPSVRKHSYKAFVNIMYGCNNFCSYCIVPYTRGRETSRASEDIIDEIKNLVKQGYIEVTLLGQNVNSYGKDLEKSISFAELLYRIDKETDIKRLRFMTSHPKDISDELIDAISELDSVCEHIHLPIQSGSNKILKLMNRNYTRERYLSVIKKAKEKIPGVSITTDMIIGFPTETEEDFLQTLDVVKEVQYDNAYTFIYSRRKGTKADLMEGQIDDKIKHERFDRVLAQVKIGAKERNKLEIGNKYEVFIEGYKIDKVTKEKIYEGRTRHNKLIHLKSSEDILYTFQQAQIESSGTFNFEGILL